MMVEAREGEAGGYGYEGGKSNAAAGVRTGRRDNFSRCSAEPADAGLLTGCHSFIVRP